MLRTSLANTVQVLSFSINREVKLREERCNGYRDRVCCHESVSDMDWRAPVDIFNVPTANLSSDATPRSPKPQSRTGEYQWLLAVHVWHNTIDQRPNIARKVHVLKLAWASRKGI